MMENSKSDLRKNSRHLGNDSKFVGWPSAQGLIVVDASLRALFSNHEAITILSYPGPPSHTHFDVLRKTLRRSLLRAQISSTGPGLTYAVIPFKSGRRTYFCRAFALDRGAKSSNRAGSVILIVLEREMPRSLALSHISQQFHLTHREQEAVALLMQGLGNKEMAEHMGISPNTVKAFLRTVTTKMDVSGRSAIVNKVLTIILPAASKPD
jgi:DNA-binding CsgD family transcriptional regulator